ncbi:unnamed protein product [Lota lota]
MSHMVQQFGVYFIKPEEPRVCCSYSSELVNNPDTPSPVAWSRPRTISCSHRDGETNQRMTFCSCIGDESLGDEDVVDLADVRIPKTPHYRYPDPMSLETE